MVLGQTVSSNDDVKFDIKANLNKNHLLHNVPYLQHRVNNWSIKKRLQGETKYFRTSIDKHQEI